MGGENQRGSLTQDNGLFRDSPMHRKLDKLPATAQRTSCGSSHVQPETNNHPNKPTSPQHTKLHKRTDYKKRRGIDTREQQHPNPTPTTTTTPHINPHSIPKLQINNQPSKSHRPNHKAYILKLFIWVVCARTECAIF